MGRAVVVTSLTLIDVGTINSVARKSIITFACERAFCVGACGIIVAVIGLLGTFINVVTSDTVTNESLIAFTLEAADCVLAASVGMTIVLSSGAFLYVSTGETVASIAVVANTSESAISVTAGGVIVANVSTEFLLETLLTLVVVDTCKAIAIPTVVTCAAERANAIFTCGVSVTWFSGALVNINAVETITAESCVTVTFVVADSVLACSMGMASVSTMEALVKVQASTVISTEYMVKFVTMWTSAVVSWCFVVADNQVTSAGMCGLGTFVNVGAVATITPVTSVTCAFVRSDGIRA
jgi:hypothetical protein